MKKLVIAFCLLTSSIAFSQNVTKVDVENVQKLDVSKPLSQEEINKYNQYFLKFVAALKSSDKNAVNNLISEKVKAIVTDDIIQKLSGGISFEKKTQVYKSGYQTLMDGVTYPAIEYKYESDNSNPPKDLITVVFENNGKILGVKPNYSK